MTKSQTEPRPSDRMRSTTLEPFPTAAAGSVLIIQGGTRVLCTASLSEEVPPWLVDPATGEASRGWVTAEYAMLPGSTPDRKPRRQDSRATEIRRLIARALRAAVDPRKMPGLQVTCDCDVLRADGGTRTASITGGWVALAQALAAARAEGRLWDDPLLGPVAAISAGVIEGEIRLDLDYDLDSRAEVDLNVVMNHRKELIEVQGTGEQGTFTRTQLDGMLDLAGRGIEQLMRLQRDAV